MWCAAVMQSNCMGANAIRCSTLLVHHTPVDHQHATRF
ncbi:hypothetical protein M3J09_003845 [Ascochyta lentis]